jgi:hypothetical protein
MSLSDKQLRSRKKASAGLSVATSTLGISALGLAGARAGAGRLVPAAQKVGALTQVGAKDIKQFKRKASRVNTGLLTTGAGIGGINGLNYASIQSTEAKRKVRKMADIGLWAEPAEEISKESKRRKEAKDTGSALGFVGGVGAGAAISPAKRVAQFSRTGYHVGRDTGTSRLRSVGTATRTATRAVRTIPKSPTAMGGAALGAVAGAWGGSLGGQAVAAHVYDRKHRKVSKASNYSPAHHTRGENAKYGAKVGGVVGGSLGAATGLAATVATKGKGLGRLPGSVLANGLLGAGVGAGAGATALPHKKSLKRVSKAYDPERKRLRRVDAYNAGANMGAGALGAASGAQAVKVTRDLKKLSGRKTVPVKSLHAAGKGAAVTAGLGLASVGAAVSADRIKQYRRGNGRTYRSITGQY